MKKNYLTKTVLIIAFVLYMLLLTWIIVFKFRLDISELKYIRTINLIPFVSDSSINGMKETFINLILFIPLGFYIQFIIKNKKILKLFIIIFVSFIFELLQYILHIGVSDITDIIMNTLGGIIGMIFMFIFYQLFSKKINSDRLDKLLSYLSIFIPILMFGCLFII